jgi:hypothetical protein
MRLQAPRGRKWLLLVGATAFVAAGAWMLPTSPLRGYSAIAFFGLGAAVLAANLLPGSSCVLLEQGDVFRKTFHRWSEIAEFLPIEVGTQTMVGLRFNERCQGNAIGRKVATYLSGVDGALPDMYGQTAQDLVSLLNNVRTRQAP